ncbi:MAG: chromosome segregation protein SMC [Candidatus Parabeggiatoa sp. nov. 2]|nr:MAG: chromosome segregation protein SMC [Beggiatoa sp. 4572_84]RKZ49930.1 MAG: chromosome segregation protein SMC [Gammaproteobacteria bacterium]
MIRQIRIENYKSIQKLKLELGRVTVLIGENGSGKSNILEAIALSAAAAADKLDNEFLASRGIRVTEASLMRAAFDKNNVTQQIKIYFGENEEIYFDCLLQNKNEPYSKWINETFNLDSVLKPLSLLNHSEHPSLIKNMDEGYLKALKNFNKASEQAIHALIDNKNYLQAFLIYSPEYHCLRNFKEEGQIQPLGINGEGLFKLLQVLSLDKNKLTEIKDKLKLMGWFQDFKIPQSLFVGERAIQIKDRYLDQEVAYFDQKSTNEGFLFLLFYFCLFISEDTPKFFASDNIDASLNPKLCRRLVKELANLAKNYEKQVILTTHNPAILDGLNLDDDEQRLFVVSRNRLGYSRARRFLKPETPEGEKLVKMSEAFLRGYIGGLPGEVIIND